VKSAEEIMNILEAYDLTGSLRDAAELAGCSHRTVAWYVAERERGRAVPAGSQHLQPVIGGFLPKWTAPPGVAVLKGYGRRGPEASV
jgi:hypothetical protein